MKMTKLLNNPNLNVFVLGLLLMGVQNVEAACSPGSITLKAPLYTITVDASKLVTYQQQVGNVVKKAVLRSDCVGYTTYTISGTKNLPYLDGTQFLVFGKNDFTSPTPAAIFLTAVNGSIDTTVTAAGAQTGRNTDSFSIYSGTSVVMRVKQPWN